MITAQGIRDTGRQVACVGLNGWYNKDLPQMCDFFAVSSSLRLGRWIKLLHRWHVNEAVLIGRVDKTRMYEPLRFLRQIPDWRLLQLWYRILQYDNRPATILTGVADLLSSKGIELIDTSQYMPQLLATEGVMTRCQPTRMQLADMEFAWPIVKELNRLDIGQAVAVKERDTIAVEAIEGTNAMIRRAGELCRSGNWTLIKTAKANHDMRLDVPTVGPTTIELLHKHGGRCLVLEAGKVIITDKDQCLKLADKLGIAIVGRSAEV
jgi:DUF1009 family protein